MNARIRILFWTIFSLALLLTTSNTYKVSKLNPESGIEEKEIDILVNENKDETKKSSARFKDGNCLLCVLLIKHGMGSLEKHGNLTKVIELIKNACVFLRLESPRVCRGGIEVFGKQAGMLLSQTEMSPEEICFLAFPDQCSISTISSTSQKWKVDLPPYPSKPVEKISLKEVTEKDTLKVLHISDVHIDFQYAPGGNAECGEPLCCRAYEKFEEGRLSKLVGNWSSKAYSVISKFSPVAHKIKSVKGAGYWGDYRTCDLPTWTFENMLETIANGSIDNKFDYETTSSNKRHIDYIIWTGDISSHDIWDQNQYSQKFLLKYMTAMLQTYFPNTKVFPATGNHDSFPSNNYPAFPETEQGRPSSWIYGALAEVWAPFLSQEALETVRRGAYYTALVQPGFRIVSLNTNFCYSENWWIYQSREEPAGMLDWFVRVLTAAEKGGEKVHVIGHVPPGRLPDCLANWSQLYYKIVERFSNTITAQYFGHTHFDEIQLFYGNEDELDPISIAYLAPSVTPYVDMNPGFRVYDVSGFHKNSTWSVVNHRTYILNLTEANHLMDPKWRLEYEALDAFNLKSLAVQSWGRLVTEWNEYFEYQKKVFPPETLVKYVKFYSKSRSRGLDANKAASHNTNLPCESMDCAKKIFCDIVKNRKLKICSV